MLNTKQKDFDNSISLETIKTLKPHQIEKIYSGKLKSCRCGCSGKYRTLAENLAYVKRVLKQIQEECEYNFILVTTDAGLCSGYIEVCTKERQSHGYAVYLAEGWDKINSDGT